MENSVTHVDTRVGAPYDSDHKVIVADIRMKLARKKKKKEETVARYWKPEDKREIMRERGIMRK